MQKRVSLKDIAQRVGVSIATVSYVINGQEKEKRVGAEVIRKIRQAAEELNYQPNQIARSLRMQSTKTIGLIVADIANPFFGHLARIIENEAAKHGFTIIIGSSDEADFKSESLINTLLNRQVDGFIIIPSEGSAKQIQSLLRKKVPVVLVDRYFPEINTSYIVLDNYQAMFDATSHLISEGYKDITLIAYESSLIHMKERIRGYLEAMDSNELKEKISLKEISFDRHQEDMEAVFEELDLKTMNKTALLFATNTLSISGLFCMQKHCLKIPKDIAFIGFDGGECFDIHSPPLSFVQQPLEEMGKESFNVLMNLINGSNKVTRIILSPVLVTRESSSC